MKTVLGLTGPHLVIVPNSTLANWQKEFIRWCPSLRSFIFHGDKEKRAHMKDHKLVAGEFDVCITSYEMVLREQSALSKFHWRYMVIDEAHRIKNEASKLADAVRAIATNNRLLLTGTPLQNNLHELWALLNFLMPDLFEHSDAFDKWFETSKEQGEESQQGTVNRLHKILKPFLLRRVKADVEKSLLPKKEVKVFVGLSKVQKDLYKKVLTKDIEAINGVAGKGKTRLMNLCMQLRKVCNHPYLFQGVEPGPPYLEGEHLVTASGKLVVLDKLLKKLQKQDSRVLIFSQMTRQLDILEDYLALRGYDSCRLDGSMGQEDREVQIEQFNAPNSRKFCFLLSTRAGGLGINLATADSVVLFDSDWNPQADLQAMDRAHRIGQKKQVMVYRLVTQDTVEQKIVERAEAKLYLDALVIQQGRLVEKHQNASGDELMRMVKFGADTIFQGNDDADYQLTDKDIDDILALGQQKTEEYTNKLRQSDLSLANFSLEGLTAPSNLYQHEGMDYAEIQRAKNKELLSTWIAPPPRETKVSSYRETHLLDPSLTKRRTRGVSSRPPGQPAIMKHQFFPERLNEIHAVETAHFKAERQVKELEEKLDADPTDEADAKELEEARKSVPRSLTEDESKERDELLKSGFLEWKRDHFNAFIRGMELYGKNAFADLAIEVGFDEEAVKTYHKVFWEKYTLLPDHEKLAARVQRGEDRREKQKDVIALLSTLFANVTDPFAEVNPLDIVGSTVNKDWLPQNDLWLLVQAYKVGYGNWSRLQRRIEEEPSFSMDWFMQTRTSDHLKERVDHLLKGIINRQKRQKRAEEDGDGTIQTTLFESTPAAESAPRKEKKKRAAPSKTDANNTSPKKKKKDEPKRAKSSYQCFQAHKRDALKAEQPGLTFSEVSTACAADWKTMDAEARKPYEGQAEEDNRRYERELAAWKEKYPEEALSSKKSTKRKVADVAYPGMPGPPNTALKFFNAVKKPQVVAANPTASTAEIRKLMATAWKECKGEAKNGYLKQASDAQQQYIADMAAWRKANPETAAKYDEDEKARKALLKVSGRKKKGDKDDASQPKIDAKKKRVSEAKPEAPKKAKVAKIEEVADKIEKEDNGDVAPMDVEKQ